MAVKGGQPELVEAVLAGRQAWYEARLAEEARAPESTWLELGLNIPGWPKRPSWSEAVFAEGVRQVLGALGAERVRELRNQAGAFALLRTSLPPEEAKHLAIGLEETHAWGRLWDLDVRGPGGSVSRTSLRRPERSCLVCEGSHQRCISEQRHSLQALRRAARSLSERPPSVSPPPSAPTPDPTPDPVAEELRP